MINVDNNVILEGETHLKIYLFVVIDKMPQNITDFTRGKFLGPLPYFWK